MKKIKTVKKEHAPKMNRKARRQLAKKIRKDLGKAVPLDTADDGRKSV